MIRRPRTSGTGRRRLLDARIAELLGLDWASIASSAPVQPGLWPIESLATRRGDVAIITSFFVPWDGGDLCVIVDASGSKPLRRLVVDGFGLREGFTPQAMTDAEWAALNP